MSRIATLAALVALAASTIAVPSAGSAAEVRFRGAFTITAVKNCAARYLSETFNSAFRPSGLGDNPEITSLTQLNEFSGDVYELPAATFKLGAWTPVRGYGIDNLHYEFDARIKVTAQSPAAINGRTQSVLLNGLIENMGNDPGTNGRKCLAAFRGAYFRRVEN